jgi:hypothetical protein
MIEDYTIRRTVDVAVDPATAFDFFTRDMHLWVQDTPYTWNDPERALGIRFEPGVGGRLVEVWDAATGEGYEWGRILEWEPGRRFVLAYRCVILPPGAETEVEVRFERRGKGTRVTLEHRGFEKLAAKVFEDWKDRAWRMLMEWFSDYANQKEPS